MSKVSIKRERSLDPEFTHKHKGDAIGEAYRLISEFFEECQRFQFIFRIGAKDSQRPGCQNSARPLGGKRIRGAPSQEGERFIQNKVARVTAPGQLCERLPRCPCWFVILVPMQVTGQKGPSIDIDHEEWGSSYR